MFKLTGFGDEISFYLEEQMDVLESEGIKHIELRAVGAKGVLDLNNKDIKEIKEQLDARGFAISAIASPIGKIGIEDDFAPHLERFKKAMHVAHAFETPYIRLFSYYIPAGEDPAKYRSEVMRRMAKKAELAEKENIIILHENERDIYGNTGERCQDILQTVNSPNLKAIFDFGNFVVERQKPFTQCFEKLVDYIVYVHIKDVKWVGEKAVITPAGEGEGEIKEGLTALKERGYEGFLSLEPHLYIAAASSGFSGPALFKTAAQALKRILLEIQAEVSPPLT